MIRKTQWKTMVFLVYPLVLYFFLTVIIPAGAFAQDKKEGARVKQDPYGVSMRVLWTVSDFVLLSGSTWNEDQARKMLFKPLDMNESSITFNGSVCRDVRFSREKWELEEYLSQKYNISTDKLGLEDQQVQVVSTSCDLPGFSEFLRLPDRRLLIHKNGVFFFFEPAVSY